MSTTPVSIAKQGLQVQTLDPEAGSERRALFKDLAMLSTGKYISFLVMLVRGFVIPKLLDPTLFGVWRSLLIITDFSRVGHLGTISALTREVPFHLGKSDTKSLARIRNVGFTSSVLSAGLISSGILASSFFVSSPLIALCLRWFAALVLVQQVILFADTYLSGCKEFGFLSRINIFRSIATAVFSIGLAWRYGLSGLIWGTVLTTALILFLFMKKLKFAVRFEFPWSTVVQLVKIGFPLLSTGILYNVLNSIDKLMVIRWLGTTEMGYYALGLTIVSFVFQLAYTFSQVVSPRLIERYSHKEQVDDVRAYVMKPLLGLGFGMPVILGGCYFASGFLYSVYLPDYFPGLTSLRVLLMGMYFGTLWVCLISFFLSLKKQAKIIPVYIAAIVVNAVLNYGFIHAGYGITGVAVGTSLANCFFSVVLIGYAVSHFYKRWSEYVRLFVQLLLPFLFGIFLVLLIQSNAKLLLKNPGGLVEVAIQFIVFSVLYAPMLLWGIRTIGVDLFGKHSENGNV